MYLLILQISYIFFLLRKAFFLLRSIIFHSPAIFKRGIAVNRTECRSKLALIAVSDEVSNISDAHFRASRKEFSRISELFSSDISAHRLTVKALEATAEICLGNTEFQCKFAYGDLINKMKIYVGIYFLYRLCNRMGKARQTLLTFISACIYKAQKLQCFQHHIRPAYLFINMIQL